MCGAGLTADISREQDTVLEVQRRERQWSRISLCVDGASDTEFGPADLILARINGAQFRSMQPPLDAAGAWQSIPQLRWPAWDD